MAETFPEIRDDAFSIRFDPAAKRVDIVLHGFWDADRAHRFDAALRGMMPVLPAHGCRIGEQATIIDVTHFDVQASDVAAELARMVGARSTEGEKIAIVASSALVRMQARRAAPGYRLFDSRAAALAWITGAD